MSSDAPQIQTSALDWGEVDLAHLPARPMQIAAPARPEGFAAVFKQSALNHLHRHGQSRPDQEICGVLVGDVYTDAAGAYVLISHTIEGDHASQMAAQVTFTAETWAHVQAIMERDFPDLRIVGWYHTHPGFGIFLSDMDLFLHGNFFNLPWQIAFVYDPIRALDGAFVWQDAKVEQRPFLTEPDAPAEDPKARRRKRRPAEEPAPPPAPAVVRDQLPETPPTAHPLAMALDAADERIEKSRAAETESAPSQLTRDDFFAAPHRSGRSMAKKIAVVLVVAGIAAALGFAEQLPQVQRWFPGLQNTPAAEQPAPVAPPAP